MIVYCLPVCDILETNTYFYIDENTKHGFLIDPAAEADKIADVISKNGWTIEKILITHGHFDHVGAVEELHKKFNIPYFAHKNSPRYLENTQTNLSEPFGATPVILKNAEYFSDQDEIFLQVNKNIKLKVIHTPGHTRDSVIFYDEKNHLAFVGDTICKGGRGRTNFPDGDIIELKKSLQKIKGLPDNTILYPSHTEPTTVADEK